MTSLKLRQLSLRIVLIAAVLVLAGTLFGTALPASAAETGDNFSLQVSPSPLVTTILPGQMTDLELNIRNAGSGTEKLKIEPRGFSFDSKTGRVHLDDTAPAGIAPWISFAAPTFTVRPGDSFAQLVHIALPKDTGFSYSFALVISRQSEPKPIAGGRTIKAALAVFTLVNVDRPGATRSLQVAELTTNRRLYEYLPASLSVTLKNDGNTIVQPFGNIFIQHGSGNPVATLRLNAQSGYILPGTSRTLANEWHDGFPTYKTITLANGKEKRSLVWDWSKLNKLRIGRYTAKLVAVYDDGAGHDVPIQAQISFWVVPWKNLLILLGVTLLLLFGTYTILKNVAGSVRKASKRRTISK